MSTQNNLNSSPNFSAYHEDGLIDIFLGIFLIFVSAAFWNKLTFMAGIWAAILIPLWTSARKGITRRRVQFGSQQNGLSGMFLITMVGLFAFGVLAALILTLGRDRLPGLLDFLDQYIHLIFGGMLSIVLLFLAAGLSTPRLTLHALACAATFAIGNILAWPLFISMGILGIASFTIGIFIFVRFLRQHPERS